MRFFVFMSAVTFFRPEVTSEPRFSDAMSCAWLLAPLLLGAAELPGFSSKNWPGRGGGGGGGAPPASVSG